MSSPSAPCCCRPRPWPPRPAANHFSRANCDRSRRSGLAKATTSPPRPPSPPSGPPFGMCFSRRKLSPPSPPRPARARIFARSWNIGGRVVRGRDARAAASESELADAYEAALAAPLELHAAVAEREDRVVAPEAGAGAGAEPRPALAHDDRAGPHLLAGEHLDAEHLRIRVAPVPGRAETFLVSHLAFLLRGKRRLQSRNCALPVRVRALVLERGFELGLPPLRGALRDLRDGHVAIALRETFRRRGGGCLLLPLLLLRLRGGRSLPADRLDLDLRQARAEARLAAVAGLRAVLADPDLFAADVADDPRRHETRLRAQVRLAVAADEQHVGREGLALVGAKPVDEQPLPFVDAVLLPSE